MAIGVSPALTRSVAGKSGKIQFVQMVELDTKEFAEKKKEYKQIFLP